MQTQNSIIEKPTVWTSNSATWDGVPVLAYPIRHGWVLWQAVQERVIYLIEKRGVIVPDDITGITLPFNPNSDYKQAELLMHNTIQWMIPKFRDFFTVDWPYWTIERALSEIGYNELIVPSPYFLSAQWLLQAYRLVNLCVKVNQNFYISTYYNSSDYGDNEALYNNDKTYYENNRYLSPFTTLIWTPRTGRDDVLIGSAGPPIGVNYHVMPDLDGDSFNQDYYDVVTTSIDNFFVLADMDQEDISIYMDGRQLYTDAQILSYINTKYPNIVIYQSGSTPRFIYEWYYHSRRYLYKNAFLFSAELRFPPYLYT